MTEISFNELVYALVEHIPYGKVLSYGRIAQMLGVPHGARAVGWAMHALVYQNRRVPWHRVVNSKGRISIKGSPEGAAAQRALLESEGVVFDDKGYLDIAYYIWDPSPVEIEKIIREARGE